MAYADARTTNRKLGAGVAVFALEAGLAWAIIAGLAYTATRTPTTRINTFSIPKEPDPKPIPTPVPAPRDPAAPTPRQQTERPFDLGPAPLPTTFAPDGDGGIAEVDFPRPDPLPVPSPRPSFTPKSAKPTGKYKSWVTTNDYPTNDLRMGHEGTTRYRLSLDTQGRVAECTVTGSSGWPGLDKATCDTLTRRALFEPATDETGVRTTGSFAGAVTWQIPEE